jgi:hypothetical protein
VITNIVSQQIDLKKFDNYEYVSPTSVKEAITGRFFLGGSMAWVSNVYLEQIITRLERDIIQLGSYAESSFIGYSGSNLYEGDGNFQLPKVNGILFQQNFFMSD